MLASTGHWSNLSLGLLQIPKSLYICKEDASSVPLLANWALDAMLGSFSFFLQLSPWHTWSLSRKPMIFCSLWKIELIWLYFNQKCIEDHYCEIIAFLVKLRSGPAFEVFMDQFMITFKFFCILVYRTFYAHFREKQCFLFWDYSSRYSY